jgi:beta-1,4-N-acetylglucosaminyltransferase
MSKSILVTVGSTKFRPLSVVFCDPLVLRAAAEAGIGTIVSQAGAAAASLEVDEETSVSCASCGAERQRSLRGDEEWVRDWVARTPVVVGADGGKRSMLPGSRNVTPTAAASTCCSSPQYPEAQLVVIDFTPSIGAIIARSSLVVGHAGAGTAQDVLLGSDAPCLWVVPNDTLQGAHQADLAAALSVRSLARSWSSPSVLHDAVITDPAEFWAFRPRARMYPASPRVFFMCVEPLCRPKPETADRPVAVVLGSGGHTGEMLRLLDSVKLSVATPRLYLAADTDNHSIKKAHAFERRHDSADTDYTVRTLPRAREVHQSWITTVWTTLVAIIAALRLVWSTQPRALIVNGPGTCIPVVLAVWLLLGRDRCPIVFVESVARVKSLSLTGRIIRRLDAANVFFVQWPELQQELRMPNAILANFSFDKV